MIKIKNQNSTVEFKNVIPSIPVKLKLNKAQSTNQRPWSRNEHEDEPSPGTALYFSIH